MPDVELANILTALADLAREQAALLERLRDPNMIGVGADGVLPETVEWHLHCLIGAQIRLSNQGRVAA